MVVDREKFELILARQQISACEMRPGISSGTIHKIEHEEPVLPKTVGRIAEILHVDPSELV